MNTDDAVVAQLNPTEDYKTSILSGLSPTVIMECTARGLAFWNYQTTQEMSDDRTRCLPFAGHKLTVVPAIIRSG